MNAPQPVPAVPVFPYRLRLEHEGLMSLCLQRGGPWIRFDPRDPPADGEIVVLTWSWPEQIQATAQALAAGRRPQVVAPQAVCDWLLRQGAPPELLHAGQATLDGVRIEQEPYQPIPWATPAEGVHKLKSALLRPDRAVSRLGRKLRLPRSAPQVTRVVMPDGGTLVHLLLALHSRTPEAWLDSAVERLGGADWLLVGCDHGEDAHVRSLLPRFGARRVLVVDLLAEVRRSAGMPTALLTPLVDALRSDGLDAYVFASKVTYRFESGDPPAVG